MCIPPQMLFLLILQDQRFGSLLLGLMLELVVYNQEIYKLIIN